MKTTADFALPQVMCFASTCLCPIFKKIHRKISFHRCFHNLCTSSANAHKMLEECKIDVALMAKPDNISGLEYYPLGAIQDTFVCTPSYLKRLNCNGFEIFERGNIMLLNKDNVSVCILTTTMPKTISILRISLK